AVCAIFALLIAGLAFTPCLPAADDTDKAKTPAKADTKNAAANKEDKHKVLALVGGDVYTVSKEVIHGGTVLVKDGKILKVGQEVQIPEGATIVDVKGKFITPGFVALSMAGIGLRQGAAPQGGGGARPAKLADSLDPYDRNMKFCLGVGITTGCIELGGAVGGRGGRSEDEAEPDDTKLCPCCGLAILPTEPIGPTAPTVPTARRHAVLKMSYGSMDGMLVSENPFHHIPGSGLAGPLNHFNWRENIHQAQKYVRDLAEHEKAIKAGEDSQPPRKSVSDDLIRLVKKEIPLRTDAASVSQIRDMLKLAHELDYHLVLENPYEGWMIPEELAAAKVSVVMTPRLRRRASPGREDTSGSSIELTRYLEKTGVPFAVVTQKNNVSMDGVDGGRDLTGFALEAAFAVRGGCSEKTALASITLTPARMLGLDNRIGSIDAGKDADLLVLNGPPLDYRTYVETAYVGGKVAYDRNADKAYPTFERAGQ
ncbi:MAG TPA: amidohydrolase family protein, partial [Gemmataceae bacterium]|nr:amidohydrolase family protein [Gemmataceae bacterium]